MAGTVVVVAEYLAVLHHARDILTRAGYRVVASTNVRASYQLARLYRPAALVLQASTANAPQVHEALAQLGADASTAGVGVLVLDHGNAPDRERPRVVAPLDGPALVRAVQTLQTHHATAEYDSSANAAGTVGVGSS